MPFTIGVIADSHGLLRPEIEQFLETCDMIIHAGDIETEELYKKLNLIAPTHAVKGNVDWEPWAKKLPYNDLVEIAGKYFYITHILDNIDLDPSSARIDAVIYGHTHMPEIFEKGSVLYMNPGSSGPRRYPKPVSAGKIIVDNNGLHPEIIYIER
jgi:putative phosphoesterase